MKYRGGVIIIGSLLWDNAVRHKWRMSSLKAAESKIPVSVKIRYGRESGVKRQSTYTMIFSNHQTTEFGKGYVIEFKQEIESKETLEEQAIALAKAEGIWTKQCPYLAVDWGAVGLLVNESKISSNWILSNWKQIFRAISCKQPPNLFNNTQYSIESDRPVISEDGLLQIDWPLEISDFDFLIATPTAPNPRTVLTAKAIAERMIEKNYRSYFDNNRSSNITTFQDNEISKFLEAGNTSNK